MKFKTNLEAQKSKLNISFNDKMFFIGSCFSENIGNYLSNHKFSTSINPFGIIYNPVSIYRILKNIISNKKYTTEDIFEHNETWKSFDFHSDISELDSNKLVSRIDNTIEEVHAFLKETKFLFITLGTSWVYINNKGKTVANCHKIPQKEFSKALLEEDEIIASFKEMYEQIQRLNPSINIIFTISPVRHIRDGIIENNQSKAKLISATHKLVSQYSNVHYFPAYEYIIDDLRDYRFFKEDLVHPNEMAIKYVLDKFETTYFNENTLLKKNSIEKVLKSLNHKVNFKETESYKKFKNNLLFQIVQLEKEGFNFSKELKKLNS